MKILYSALILCLFIFSTQAQGLEFSQQNGKEDVFYSLNDLSPGSMPRLNNSLSKPMSFAAHIVNPSSTVFTEVFLAAHVYDPSNNLVGTYYSDTIASIPVNPAAIYTLTVDSVIFWNASSMGDFRVETEVLGKDGGNQVSKLSAETHKFHFGNHIGWDSNQAHNFFDIDNVAGDTLRSIAIRLGVDGTTSLEGFSIFFGKASACGEITAKLYADSTLNLVNGFTGVPIVQKTFQVSGGVMLEHRPNGKFIYYDFNVPSFALTGPAKAYYLTLDFDTKSGTCPLSIANDSTSNPQFSGLNTLFYMESQARWFSGFVNNLTFHRPLLRMYVDGFVPTVSLNESVGQKQELVLFPNPSQNSIKLDLSKVPHLRNPSLTFHDLSGKKILEISDIQSFEALDISMLHKGTYQTTLVVEGRAVMSKLFVKQ